MAAEPGSLEALVKAMNSHWKNRYEDGYMARSALADLQSAAEEAGLTCSTFGDRRSGFYGIDCLNDGGQSPFDGLSVRVDHAGGEEMRAATLWASLSGNETRRRTRERAAQKRDVKFREQAARVPGLEQDLELTRRALVECNDGWSAERADASGLRQRLAACFLERDQLAKRVVGHDPVRGAGRIGNIEME